MPYLQNDLFSDDLYNFLHQKNLLKNKSNKTYNDYDVTKTLYTVFGEKRVNRACSKLKLESHLKDISKKDLRRLFAKLALIKLEDLKDLYLEISQMELDVCIRGLDVEKSQTVRDSLFIGGHLPDFNQLTKEQLDVLMHVLLPFKQLNHIFLDKPPTISIEAPDSGKSEQGKMELAYILNLLRFKKPLDSKERQIYYAKRITDREPNKDIVIPHENGYYFVFDKISEGSVYATLLKPISRAFDDLIPMVLFRGTRVFPSATQPFSTAKAALNDNQANYTFPSFFEKLDKVINPPEDISPYGRQGKKERFIEPDEQFAVGGMSLGGGHAALTAEKYASRVSRIELTAPIGLLNESLENYANYINNNQRNIKFKPIFVRIVDEEDTVTHLANGHLGRGCLKHIDYTLYCAVSDKTYHRYKDNQSEFWQDHLNNRHTNMPGFFLNTRLGGLIRLLQGLCGQHTHNPYSIEDNPHFFSRSNAQQNDSELKEEDLFHNDNSRYYVELGRRSSGQLIAGGLSTMFGMLTATSVICLVTLSVASVIACMLSPVGVSLIITASVFLTLTLATAALSIALSPNCPKKNPNMEEGKLKIEESEEEFGEAKGYCI